MPPSYSEGLEFTLGIKELPPIIDVLRNQEKADLIILVSHLGFPQDMKLISDVSGIDICLSGHTHNRLDHLVLQGKNTGHTIGLPRILPRALGPGIGG